MQPDAFETMEGQGHPGVRQLSVFVENRCGQLLRLTQVMETRDVRILSLSVMDSVECSVIRILTDDPDSAIDALRSEGFALSVAEVLVVKIPPGRHGLLQVWTALLRGEVNVAYAYPLLSRKHGPTMAMNVDSIDVATETLMAQGFDVLGEGDLGH
jgi:hypothetical protein